MLQLPGDDQHVTSLHHHLLLCTSTSLPGGLGLAQLVDVLHVAPELDLEHGEVVPHRALGEHGQVRVP